MKTEDALLFNALVFDFVALLTEEQEKRTGRQKINCYTMVELHYVSLMFHCVRKQLEQIYTR